MKDYVNSAALQEYTTKLVAKLKTLFPGTPTAAATVADMTDHSKTYVYVGSETGYTAGDWYYWNGTAWTSGGPFQATSIITDTTLAVAGEAADAKATGDAIAAAKTAVLNAMAPAYSTSATYAVGAYVNYNGGIYRCTTEITTAESWTSGHWTAVVLGADLASQVSDLKTQIKAVNVFDPTSIPESNKDHLLNMSGTITNNPGGFYSDYIDLSYCNKMVVYPNMGSASYGHCFYDAEKTFLSAIASSGTGSLYIDIPANAKYARIVGFTARINDTIVLLSVLPDAINAMIESELSVIMRGKTYTNKFASANGQDVVGLYDITGAGCEVYSVSSLVGKAVKIKTKRFNSTYTLLYEFADIDGNAIVKYTSNNDNIFESFVNVPQNAETLYVNYKLSDDVHTVVGYGVNIASLMLYSEIFEQIYDENFPRTDIYGKSIVTYGDSLTWYDGHAFTWGDEQGTICIGFQSYLRDILKMSVTNRGDSGKTTPYICNLIKAASDLSTFDYLTIMGGDNDARLNVTLGTLQPVGGTFNTSTIYGALQSAIEYALAQSPKLRIVLMTEPMGWTYVDGAMERISEDIPNAYRRVADLYGLPLIDNWSRSGVNELTRNYYYLDPDDTENTDYMYHPNNIGWKQISKIICEEIAKY